MIISFAWTTDALLAGAKTATRREWTAEHAARFRRGDLVQAWNRSPRVGRARGARRVATIRLTADPRCEWSSPLSEADYAAEGFVWLRARGDGETVDDIVRSWREDRRLLWVVEFELVSIEPGVGSPR